MTDLARWWALRPLNSPRAPWWLVRPLGGGELGPEARQEEGLDAAAARGTEARLEEELLLWNLRSPPGLRVELGAAPGGRAPGPAPAPGGLDVAHLALRCARAGAEGATPFEAEFATPAPWGPTTLTFRWAAEGEPPARYALEVRRGRLEKLDEATGAVSLVHRARYNMDLGMTRLERLGTEALGAEEIKARLEGELGRWNAGQAPARQIALRYARAPAEALAGAPESPAGARGDLEAFVATSLCLQMGDEEPCPFRAESTDPGGWAPLGGEPAGVRFAWYCPEGPDASGAGGGGDFYELETREGQFVRVTAPAGPQEAVAVLQRAHPFLEREKKRPPPAAGEPAPPRAGPGAKNPRACNGGEGPPDPPWHPAGPGA